MGESAVSESSGPSLGEAALGGKEVQETGS